MSFLSGHNPLMMLTVNKSGFVQIDFTNRNLVHPVQWPLALKSKNDFYSFKLLRTLQAPDVVFENGDFGTCSCGGDHCEDYTFICCTTYVWVGAMIVILVVSGENWSL